MRVDQRELFGAGAASCVLLILLIAVGAPAQETHKRVLLLYDEDRTLPGLAILDQSLRSRLSASLGDDVEFFTESMNVSQFNDERHQEVLRNYYTQKYRDEPPDLVMAVMGPALKFLLRYGGEAFPGVPIVFCGADAADLEGTSLPDHVTGVLVQRVFAPTIDVVLRLQPETTRIVVVGGTSAFDRHLTTQARQEFRAFEPRVAFEYPTDLPMPDLLATVSRAPARSAIVFVSFFRDGTGRTFVPHDVVSQLSSAASVPVYIVVDQHLGRGPVGGHLYSLEQHGTSAAEIGLRVLQGARPSSIPVRELRSTANMFDARELARWHLDEARLPADSIVRFREPNLFDRYKSYILAGAALLAAQAAMIAGLLIQGRRRRRAETELRRSHERIRNLGGRLLNAQDAERAHLARELHDDVGQQMVLLKIELQALMSKFDERSLAGALAEVSAHATAIGTSVHDLSHRLHPAQLRLVGLTGALRDLQRQLSTSHVSVAFSHENVPASLSEDVVVCLYRIAQEAVNNAIKHGHAANIVVGLRGEPGGVQLTVDDNGVGFDPGTASSGLGLISMTERVEQVGGSVDVRSQPGHGTHVEAHVPASLP